MEKLLDIEYLKGTGCQPKWFGLGFIQLKLDEQNRMHFWHPDLKADDEAFYDEYHDHRYDFNSRVLVGEITNTLVCATPDGIGEYSLFDVCCSGGGQTFVGTTSVEYVGAFTAKAGQEYYLQRDTFHQVDATTCVTLQSRSGDLKEKARVIQRKNRPSANPFSSHIETDKLWGYIADLLPKQPGYHLREIDKGVLGEASKIREEAEELIDAFEQGARVMQLVELSDMMGAVEAFLTRHHPGYTLDDLKTFSEITKRAFRNGRRT